MTEIPHADLPEDRIRQLEQEIAESRKAIGDIQREQLFSEKVLDSLPGIFYLYNQEGEIIRWNKNHETLLGFGPGELQDRSLLEWHLPNRWYVRLKIQDGR